MLENIPVQWFSLVIIVVGIWQIFEMRKNSKRRDEAVLDIKSLKGKTGLCAICKHIDGKACDHFCGEDNALFEWRGLDADNEQN